MSRVIIVVPYAQEDTIATIEEVSSRVTTLETEFRTELKHLTTKADLKDLEMRLMMRLGGLMVTGFAVVIAVLRLWE